MIFVIPPEFLTFFLFADDSSLFFDNKSLPILESTINNSQLEHINKWLCVNKLSLNIDKTNFVIFHPPQKKISSSIQLTINNKLLKQTSNFKYLGVVIDSNLNFKAQVLEISKKIKRNIGAISKIRNFVTLDILINLYYSLIYPFLTYALVAWGNTYNTTVNPLAILQKKIIHLITFSNYQDHTNSSFNFVFSSFMTLFFIIMHCLCMTFIPVDFLTYLMSILH